jgi:hypothetical protein
MLAWSVAHSCSDLGCGQAIVLTEYVPSDECGRHQPAEFGPLRVVVREPASSVESFYGYSTHTQDSGQPTMPTRHLCMRALIFYTFCFAALRPAGPEREREPVPGMSLYLRYSSRLWQSGQLTGLNDGRRLQRGTADMTLPTKLPTHLQETCLYRVGCVCLVSLSFSLVSGGSSLVAWVDDVGGVAAPPQFFFLLSFSPVTTSNVVMSPERLQGPFPCC